MNTPIQEAIGRIQVKIKHFEGKDDLDLTLRERGILDAYINSVKILESLIEKEYEYFIQFGLDCQEEMYCDNNGDLKALGRPHTLFEQIFKKSTDATKQ